MDHVARCPDKCGIQPLPDAESGDGSGAGTRRAGRDVSGGLRPEDELLEDQELLRKLIRDQLAISARAWSSVVPVGPCGRWYEMTRLPRVAWSIALTVMK
jgi:hypothetical protein